MRALGVVSKTMKMMVLEKTCREVEHRPFFRRMACGGELQFDRLYGGNYCSYCGGRIIPLRKEVK